MKLGVRLFLRDTVHDFLAGAGFRLPTDWLRIWVAGSGASYQWSAARDPGDLDVLLGVDYPSFREHNLRYHGLSDVEIADTLNDRMQGTLWPRTANQLVGGSHYEVTWFVNPRSTDIRSINPYAAYDVDRNEWAVRPIDLPAAGPGEWFPQGYADAAHGDQLRAESIVSSYNRARENLGQGVRVGDYVNASAALAAATKQAEALFDEIHEGRHAAFDPGGEGYRDFANYRWQRGKLLGTVPALRAIHSEAKAARNEAEMALYGQKLVSTEHARVEAALGGRR